MGTGRIIQADNIDGLKTVKNFISNGLATLNTTGWATYADAAGTRPVDGTGGSPNVTFTRTTTSPLSDAASFLLTKDAANRQGQGASYNFTIDSKDQAKVLKIEADYIVNSGTFAAGSRTTDSDVIVYIYDVTNSTLIEPSSFKFLSNSTTISDKFSATFQTSATGTQYRLIFHVASTSTAAYALKFDNISVSPSQYVYGTPVVDLGEYTPVFTNLGTVTAQKFEQYKVGKKLKVKFKFIAASGGASVATVSLPPGLTVSSTGNEIVGAAWAQYTSSKDVFITAVNGGSVIRFILNNGSGAPLTGSDFGSGIVDGWFEVDILGWSSSVQMSDSVTWTDDVGQIVPFAKTTTPASVTDAPSGYLYADGSAVSRATYYELFSRIGTSYGAGDGSTTFNLPNLKGIFVRGAGSQTFGSETYSGTAGAKQNDATAKNGLTLTDSGHNHTNTSGGAFVAGGAGTTSNVTSGGGTFVFSNLNPANSNITLNNGDAETRPANMALHYFIKYTRTAAPTISASETVACRYTNTAGTTINATSTPVPFANKVYDTHGAFDGSTFRAPIAGFYRIAARGILTSVKAIFRTFILKNGSVYSEFLFELNNSTQMVANMVAYDEVYLLAGETISISMQSDGSSGNLQAGTKCALTISKM